MRQLLIQVPAGKGLDAARLAGKHDGVNISRTEARRADGEQGIELIRVDVSNQSLDPLLDALQDIPDLHVSWAPTGVFSLHPPKSETPSQVLEVEHRGAIEVFLAGLQSVGSWTGFLGYAMAAGVVVWIGLFTGKWYLLTAAMLIAPFVGPAMNTAIASARGDTSLLRRNLLRYFSALGVTIATAALLSLLMHQRLATQLMVGTSEISLTAVLLPLVAGAAGAMNLIQSERSSLVSGAATGMLVAASLAPPAGVVGMASVLGEWNMVKSAGFLLLLQLACINFSGALVFHYYGKLSYQGTRYSQGRRGVFPLALAVSALIMAALLAWQFASPPNLQRASIAEHATQDIHTALKESPLVAPVDVTARFTRSDIAGQNTLLVIAYVQRKAKPTRSDAQIRQILTKQLAITVRRHYPNVTPLVSVTVLEKTPE